MRTIATSLALLLVPACVPAQRLEITERWATRGPSANPFVVIGGMAETPRGAMFGQVALIVVGVLAALAVDQWVASRQDRQREREYLTRLAADLIETRESVEGTIAAFRGFLEHGRAVARG